MFVKRFSGLGALVVLVLAHAGAVLGAHPGPLPEPYPAPLPEPPPLVFANVSVEPPTISPSPVVPLASGYTVAARVKSTGTITATKGVELRLAGETTQHSEVLVGDLSSGSERTVTMPALFDAPRTMPFDLVATVTAENEALSGDNKATYKPPAVDLPLVLHWAGFDVEVTSLLSSSVLTSMGGTGNLLIPTAPPVRIPISFRHVAADAHGSVLSADPVSESFIHGITIQGANGVVLVLSNIELTPEGPLLVTGFASLPDSTGIEAINGRTVGEFAGRVLTPGLVLRSVSFSQLRLRDLPLEISSAAAVDFSLTDAILFSVDGTAKGRPSWICLPWDRWPPKTPPTTVCSWAQPAHSPSSAWPVSSAPMGWRPP
ncbi:MAG: hypothetical protein ACUVRO_08530 [Armatimonadota bacterium]